MHYNIRFVPRCMESWAWNQSLSQKTARQPFRTPLPVRVLATTTSISLARLLITTALLDHGPEHTKVQLPQVNQALDCARECAFTGTLTVAQTRSSLGRLLKVPCKTQLRRLRRTTQCLSLLRLLHCEPLEELFHRHLSDRI